MSLSYRDLKAWQRAVVLVVEVYGATRSFPREEIYGLTSQLRRAAVSVPSNIAEGKGRSSDKEFVLFLYHARGSLLEVETQVLIARELRYLSKDRAESLLGVTGEVGRILNGLIASMER